MADPTPTPAAKTPGESPHFETSDVQANRAIEQGLGVGARELAAQRDPGGVVTPDEDADSPDGVSINAGDEDALDQSVGVQGAKNDDEQLSSQSEA